MIEDHSVFDNIRINDWLWATFQKHLISFRWIGLPPDVHVTIAFNDNSPYLNIHITKNVENVPVSDKPKIEIVRILKSDLIDVTPQVTISIISKLLTPFNLEQFLNLSPTDIRFIPYESFDEKDTAEKSKAVLVEIFGSISRIEKKTRLKIDGDIEGKFVELKDSELLQEIARENLVQVTNNFQTNGGLLRFGEDQVLPLLKIEDQWFILNLDVELMDILKSIVPEPLAHGLKKYWQESIANIQLAKTKEDCAKHNNPIILHKINTNQNS